MAIETTVAEAGSPGQRGNPRGDITVQGRNKATANFPIWKLLTGPEQECQKIQRFPRDQLPHFHSEIHLRTCRARDTQHQNRPPTAVCQEWAPGPRQRGQQEAEPSELAKVQRGNFLERHGDVTERGPELLVGQVGTLARMNRTGDKGVSQVFYLSTALSGLSATCSPPPPHPLPGVSLSILVSLVFSLSPHLPVTVSESELISIRLSFLHFCLGLSHLSPSCMFLPNRYHPQT